jgi:hypothetical protein
MSTYARIHCSHPGCNAHLDVQAKHAANLSAGGWYCNSHEDDK